MMITFRGTFLEASSAASARPRRALSAPPAEAPLGDDIFEAQRVYASTLLERAERLPKAAAGTQEHQRTNDLGMKRVDSHSTAVTSAGQDSSISDSSCGEDEEEFRGTAQLQDGARNAPSGCEDSRGPRGLPSAGPCSEDESEELTTLMICNLPCKVMEEQLALAVDSTGFAGRYDFLYIPKGHRRISNLGYAFINFLSATDMEEFVRRFTGYHFAGIRSNKTCYVKPARLQGVERNMAQLSTNCRLTE